MTENVAKYSLGKVKIESTLVAGLCFIGINGLPPKLRSHDEGKGSAPPLCRRGTLLVLELILADHFACVLSESLRIQALSPPFPSAPENNDLIG